MKDSVARVQSSNDGVRNVTLERQPGGGLGISVKGGAEHGIPVLISRVFSGQSADQTHLLQPGDAILTINGKKVDQMKHDDVVAELRACGENVMLTVRAFEGADKVLYPPNAASRKGSKKSKTKPQPTSSKGGSTSPPPSSPVSPPTDTSRQLWRNQSTRLNSPVTLPAAKDRSIPLLYARLEGYHRETDKVRETGFEVFGVNDEAGSGVVECGDAKERGEWMGALSNAIHEANMRRASHMIDDVTSETVVHMGWVAERSASQSWKPRFMVLSGEHISLFDSPPTTKTEWSACKRVHKLYECLCRAHPASRLLDDRQHCFSIQHGSDPPLYFNVATEADAKRWNDSLQNSTTVAVLVLQSKSYPCVYKEQPCLFTVHINDGFQLTNTDAQETLWSYKFSQLKGSTDDGDSLVTFTFQNRTSGCTDEQSFSCASAHPLLFCIHAFLAAKLSKVDRALLDKINAHARNASSRQLRNVQVNGHDT